MELLYENQTKDHGSNVRCIQVIELIENAQFYTIFIGNKISGFDDAVFNLKLSYFMYKSNYGTVVSFYCFIKFIYASFSTSLFNYI